MLSPGFRGAFGGVSVPIDFIEVESASAEAQEKRTENARLLKMVRPGDLVIVSKLDLFSRDIVFTFSAVREILRRGARFLSLAERFDASTPEGETQMARWASIAQMERARIKERTEGNRKRLRGQGKFVEGLPSLGYLRAKGRDKSDTPCRLEIDPVRAAAVRDMFERCINGESVLEISAYLRSRYKGAATFGQSWVMIALKNRIYTGQLALTPVQPGNRRTTGQVLAQWVDAHEPILTFDQWSLAQKGACQSPQSWRERSYGVEHARLVDPWARPLLDLRNYLLRDRDVEKLPPQGRGILRLL